MITLVPMIGMPYHQSTPNGDEIGNMDVVIIHVLSSSHVMTNIQTQKQI